MDEVAGRTGGRSDIEERVVPSKAKTRGKAQVKKSGTQTAGNFLGQMQTSKEPDLTVEETTSKSSIRDQNQAVCKSRRDLPYLSSALAYHNPLILQDLERLLELLGVQL